MTSIVRKNTPRVSGVELVTTLLSATAVVLPLATDLLQGDDPSPRYALPLSLSLLFYSLPLSLTHSYSRRIAFFFVFAPSSLSSSCFSPFPEEETVAAFALVLRVFSLPLSIFHAEPRLARSSRVGLSLFLPRAAVRRSPGRCPALARHCRYRRHYPFLFRGEYI